MPPSLARLATIALCLGFLAGCGGEDVILPRDGEPADIAVVDGDDQRGRVGEPLTDPLVVQVTDLRGRPVEGATVAFDFASAGTGAAVVPEEKTTDADGLADARLVLGTNRGQQTGQARVVVAEGRDPIQASFSAMALPENANSMAAVAGQDQTGHVGLPLDDRLVVEVTDGFGNPVAGVPISWAAAGGGSVSEAVVETDEDGRSRVDRTLGPTVGQQTALASSEGLAGSPVIFVHTALSGDASRLVIISGSDQTAEAGSVLPGELVVELRDADGNGVPQTALSWVVATGGGSATPEITTTDGDGRTSTRWKLGGTLGPQRLDAVVSAVGFVSFRATATAGPPASLFIRTQPSASARNGVPLARQPVLQLRDSRGTDVAQAGVQVTVAIGFGGGELGGTRQVGTDAAGRATFSDLSISGAPGPRTLIFTASGYAQVTSNEIALESIGTSTAITSDSPDPSVSGSTFTVAFRVTSTGPTPTGSVTVTVNEGGPNCTGPLSDGAGSCPLTINRVGDRTLTATYLGGSGFAPSAGTASHRVDAPPAENHEPFADFNWNCSGLTCNFTDNSRDDEGYETITARRWDFGDGMVVTGNQLTLSHTYDTPGDRTVTLTVTDNGNLSDDSSDRVNPRTPPAQTLRIEKQPSRTATVGEAFENQPEIELRLGDERQEQSGVTVTATIASGGGILGGTTTAVTEGDGRAQFSDLSISGATGSHTLTFSAEGFGSVTSDPIDVRKIESRTEITYHEPEPAVPDQPVTVAVSVTGDGTPSGTVTVGGENVAQTCTITLSSGSGLCDISFTASASDGDNQITANYNGDGRFDVSHDDVTHDVNQAPTALDDVATTEAGVAVTIPVRANDSDPEGTVLTIENVSDPENGSVAVDNENGTITYAPDAGFGGETDAFTYSASDGSLSDGATVTVTVGSVPAPPPAELGIITQPSIQATSGVPFDQQPIVQLRDGSGGSLAIPGVQVRAAIALGSGTRSGNDSTTDEAGQARFTDLAISGSGTHTLSFTADDYTSVTSNEIDVAGGE